MTDQTFKMLVMLAVFLLFSLAFIGGQAEDNARQEKTIREKIEKESK